MDLDAVLQYDIPVLHPLAVHFPTALLMAAAFAAAVYAVHGRAFWRGATFLLASLGALGAIAAVRTGETMYRHVEGSPVVEELVGQHELMGRWTLASSVVLVLVLLAVWYLRRGRSPAEREPLALRLIVFASALVVALLVAYTAHIGGVMVWGVRTF
jgi:uncharacterized membrane protein